MPERRIGAGLVFFQIKFLQVSRVLSGQGGFIQNARGAVLMGWSFAKVGVNTTGSAEIRALQQSHFPPASRAALAPRHGDSTGTWGRLLLLPGS